MSYKEQYYNLIGKATVQQLKLVIDAREMRFDEVMDDYESFEREEQRYQQLVEQYQKLLDLSNKQDQTNDPG